MSEVQNKELLAVGCFLSAMQEQGLSGAKMRVAMLQALGIDADKQRQEIDAAKAESDFYKRRVDLLQQWQSKMRDPERTICYDIIANGQTLPPENAGDRYAVKEATGAKQ